MADSSEGFEECLENVFEESDKAAVLRERFYSNTF